MKEKRIFKVKAKVTKIQMARKQENTVKKGTREGKDTKAKTRQRGGVRR